MSSIDKDAGVIDELNSQDISGLTERGKIAIKDLAGYDIGGPIIFLILTLNSRIRDLEKALENEHDKELRH